MEMTGSSSPIEHWQESLAESERPAGFVILYGVPADIYPYLIVGNNANIADLSGVITGTEGLEDVLVFRLRLIRPKRK